MAITRTQIAKQLLAQGGRTGFQGGGADLGTASSRDFGFGDRDARDDRAIEERMRNIGKDSPITPPPKPPKTKDNFIQPSRFFTPTTAVLNFIGEKLSGSKLAMLNNAIQRNNYLATLTPDEQVETLEDLAAIGIGADNPMGIDRNIERGVGDRGILGTGIGGNKFITDPDFGGPEAKAILGEGYENYLEKQKNRFTSDDRGGEPPIIPIVPQTISSTTKDEEDTFIPNFRLLAEGGRVEAQEGGGIEQRLEQLGGDVTSAERVLQGINQRLKTAESSLGSGGGIGGLPAGFGTRPLLDAKIDPNFKPVEELKAVQPGDPGYRAPGPTTLNGVVIDNPLLTESRERIFNNIPEEYRAGFAEFAKGRPIGVGGQAISSVGLPGGGSVTFGDTGSAKTFRDYLSSIGFTPPGPQVAQLPAQGSLGIPAAGYADGGNVVGGEFDFESARQMYGLGKLVKKVTRTVKKIAKSPLGKAAILGAGTYFGLGQFGATKDLGLLAKLGIAGTTAALPFLTKEEEEDSLYAGADIADPRFIMANPQRFQNIRTMAEGGSTEKEPVAKKTMPLLDMGGKEMDLRAEGGFVPIGRMEKADDVPARLSKNEFVFTADAVRNAGDGDVDKGAEVMYNMMKNLEAGGDVSEESQGLEGARKMFQTSQRLEEVL